MKKEVTNVDLEKYLLSVGFTLNEVVEHARAMGIDISDSQLEAIVYGLAEDEGIYFAKMEAINSVIMEITDERPDPLKASGNSSSAYGVWTGEFAPGSIL